MTPVDSRPSKPRGAFLRKAMISLVVSGGLLALILARLDLAGLGAALAGIEPAGLITALLLFGVAVVCTGLRWRIGLVLTGVSLAWPANLRAMFGGHCLNMLLFGPAGGDVAKSAAYSRWYGLPLHELLVAAITDRSLAALGSLSFLLLAVALVLAGGAALPSGLALDPSGLARWLAAGAACALVIAGVAYRFRHQPFLASLGRSLRGTIRSAQGRPGLLATGTLLGLCAQLLMSLSMAFALEAVLIAPLDWSATLWAFPLITAAAALPTSFGGAGVREAISILLLARYGIPAESLVAAGLVYLVIQLGWASLGALLLGAEERLFRKRGAAGGP
jgi:uncharacterized membrane protein YbhN (UPF0104 family)